MPSNQPLVLLEEVHGERHLPIWIGTAEATAIALAQQGVVPPRPMTHDLLVNVVRTLGHSVVSVNIMAVEDNIFYGQLLFDDGTQSVPGPRTRWPSPCAPTAGSGALTMCWTKPGCASPNMTRVRTRTRAHRGGGARAARFREFLDDVNPRISTAKVTLRLRLRAESFDTPQNYAERL